jgi:hypothetical protein
MEQTGAPPGGGSGDGDEVRCVWCRSPHVERIAEFGPGLMTEQWMCLDCHSPFEWIRKR